MIRVTEIDNQFHIDLTNRRIQFTEENNWFTDSLVSAYTLPEKLPYDIHPFFLKYKSNNAEEYEVRYDVVVNLNNEIFSARFEIVSLDNNFFSFSIFYGQENFPNWDKKLSDLNLPDINVSNIRNHATEINSKFYPEVNYYFPCIHTDQYSTDDLNFANFKGSINLKENNTWLVNEIDTTNNIIYNRTIIRPYMYWLYVLEQVITQAGYKLEGDIYNVDKLKKLILTSGKKFELKDRPQTIDWTIGLESYIREGFRNRLGKGWQYGRWESTQEINFFGQFRLKGIIHNWNRKHHDVRAYIYLDDQLIWSKSGRASYNVDFTFKTKKGGSKLKLIAYDYQRDSEKTEILITPIELFDDNGNLISYTVDSNIIDLKLALPDTTQGTFIQATINWFNVDFTVKNNGVVSMNLKEKYLRSKKNPEDWTFTEVYEKERSTNLGDSYLLKFKNSDDENYPLIQTFINQNGYYTENFIINDNTTTINIDSTPLPLLMRNNQMSAYIYKDDVSNIYAVLRNDSTNDNQTVDMIDFQTPSITEEFYKTWIRFRIKTVQYSWEFETKTRFLDPFNIKKEKYCYGNIHFVKKIQRDIENNIEEVSVETLVLR
ncbi:hypothetical protein [Chishuiella sp.]|uniref:hypothetical protein n=1 Tax=Chishuiella sp. TaxID=1969467 RepID=UPI0028A70DE8|nr:hypothetical protein [Chishuiella sp.]